MSLTRESQGSSAEVYDQLDDHKIHLGHRLLDEAEGTPSHPIQMTSKTLLRHIMALGSSGSGKTVFCKVVVEEMTRLGLPAICIDPQGEYQSSVLPSLRLHSWPSKMYLNWSWGGAAPQTPQLVLGAAAPQTPPIQSFF